MDDIDRDAGRSAMADYHPFLLLLVLATAISLLLFFLAVPFGFTPKLFWRCPCCGHSFPYYVPARGDNLREKDCKMGGNG